MTGLIHIGIIFTYILSTFGSTVSTGSAEDGIVIEIRVYVFLMLSFVLGSLITTNNKYYL